jgi:hypothetical protein
MKLPNRSFDVQFVMPRRVSSLVLPLALALCGLAQAQVGTDVTAVPPLGTDALPTMFFEQDGDVIAKTKGQLFNDWAVSVDGTTPGVIDNLNFVQNPLFPLTAGHVCIVSDNFTALMCRDPNWSSQANPATGVGMDVTQYAGSNKNNDFIGNPGASEVWEWGGGTSGGPQKNDLTNCYLYSFVDKCGEGGCEGHRWVAFGAETRATNGDSHFDIEFNQEGISVIGTDAGLLVGNATGPGTLGGRSVDKDFIISVDFVQGGSQPTSSLRVWRDLGGGMGEYLAPDPIPTYSCACNTSKNGVPAVYIRTVDEDEATGPNGTVPGGPWGHFAGNGSDAANILPLQFVEGAVDLTAFGVLFDPCSSDSTALFKTRSSGSFTSELKDFSLLPFQLQPTPVCEIDGPTAVCPGEEQIEFTVTDTAGIEGVTFEWEIMGAATFCPGTDVTSDTVMVCADLDCDTSFDLMVTATSPEGCESTCNWTVSVDDNTNPSITCPQTINLECSESIPAPYADLAAFEAAGGSASDNCGTPTFSFEGEQSSGTCPTVITRTYRVTDACGNIDECTQTINVDDTTDPSITCPQTINLECDQSVPEPYADLAAFEAAGGSASDNCGTPTFSFEGEQSSGTCPTVITRTYRVTDDCGNFTECTQTINVDDTMAPVVTCPTGGTLECNVTTKITATASDNCDTTPDISCEITSGGDIATLTPLGGGMYDLTITQSGSVTITCTATDDCGNTSEQCSTVFTATCIVGEGCTPGYWKTHEFAWDGIVGNPDPNDVAAAAGFEFDTPFFAWMDSKGGIPNPGGFFDFGPDDVPTLLPMIDQHHPGLNGMYHLLTMDGAMSVGGGNPAKMTRHLIAALLNLAANLNYDIPGSCFKSNPPTGVCNGAAGLKAEYEARMLLAKYAPFAQDLADANQLSICPCDVQGCP